MNEFAKPAAYCVTPCDPSGEPFLVFDAHIFAKEHFLVEPLFGESYLAAHATARLEADEKAKPVGYVSPITGVFYGYEHADGKVFKFNERTDVYLAPDSAHSSAERLAEALRSVRRKIKSFGWTTHDIPKEAAQSWVEEIETALAAHDAKAQPTGESIACGAPGIELARKPFKEHLRRFVYWERERNLCHTHVAEWALARIEVLEAQLKEKSP